MWFQVCSYSVFSPQLSASFTVQQVCKLTDLHLQTTSTEAATQPAIQQQSQQRSEEMKLKRWKTRYQETQMGKG